MRLWSLSAASRLFPSDTFRHSPTRAGMAGLRHKQRHSTPRTTTRVPGMLICPRAGLSGCCHCSQCYHSLRGGDYSFSCSDNDSGRISSLAAQAERAGNGCGDCGQSLCSAAHGLPMDVGNAPAWASGPRPRRASLRPVARARARASWPQALPAATASAATAAADCPARPSHRCLGWMAARAAAASADLVVR